MLLQKLLLEINSYGPLGAGICLDAGANDLGGTLMNETITRSAGASHGQEFSPEKMDDLIKKLGKSPSQRSTLYGVVNSAQELKSYAAIPLEEVVNNNVKKYSKKVKPQFFNTLDKKPQHISE